MKTETASRVRGRIEQILDWAKVRGMRKGENPARWRGHLDKLLPKRSKVTRVKHHAAMPYADVPAFMACLRAMESTSARALELTILTATRTSEIIHATWNEFEPEDVIFAVEFDADRGRLMPGDLVVVRIEQKGLERYSLRQAVNVAGITTLHPLDQRSKVDAGEKCVGLIIGHYRPLRRRQAYREMWAHD